MIAELRRIWKEVAVAYSSYLSPHLAGETEENHEEPREGLCLARISNPGPPEYKSRVLPLLQPTRC
jgi:hypothetical protein